MPQLDVARIQSLVKEGKSYTEIAQELGCTKSAIASQVRRARLRTIAKTVVEAAPYANASDRSALFLQVMSTDCDETLNRIRTRRLPQCNKTELERESVLEKLNRRARATYGLDREVSQSVNVGLSISITKPPLDPTTPVVEPTAVIEVSNERAPEVQPAKSSDKNYD